MKAASAGSGGNGEFVSIVSPATESRENGGVEFSAIWLTFRSSGKLNAKHRELLELQAKAQARLAKTRERFTEGYRDAQDVRADLEWTQKKVS